MLKSVQKWKINRDGEFGSEEDNEPETLMRVPNVGQRLSLTSLSACVTNKVMTNKGNGNALLPESHFLGRLGIFISIV